MGPLRAFTTPPNFGRERWVYGPHALLGLLLGLPTLGLIGDWHAGAPERFLLLLAMGIWFAIAPLVPGLALGWVALVGY